MPVNGQETKENPGEGGGEGTSIALTFYPGELKNAPSHFMLQNSELTGIVIGLLDLLYFIWCGLYST